MPEASDPLALFDAPPAKPKQWLLTANNSDLNRGGAKIYTWTLPAWWTILPDGRRFNTCPEASACANLCYATVSTSSFRRLPNVLLAHQRNLMMTLDTPGDWERWMTEELRHVRYRGAVVRVHDAGDFYSDDYTRAWLRIMRSAPATRFYAYTKAVGRFARIVAPAKPDNFKYTLSLGGKEDHLVDVATQRHADVFPTAERLEEAGYLDQAASDLLAVAPGVIRVGMVANPNPITRKRQGPHTFGELQRARNQRLADKRRRHPPAASLPESTHTPM
ncbi:hypothetical protein ACIQF6_35875 [Kitasatospora sp. NPDC092948]|uniref:GP88 family protein n=1 Tax=Kitasatospora sp. NPDC092948 TaxID=3364088 RepID=UPI00382C3C03